MVGANISGMIQDRIEKLGRDVFYDMLSNGREPLHALCVLKVRTGQWWHFITLTLLLTILPGWVQVLLRHVGQGQQSQLQPLRGIGPGLRGLHPGQVVWERPILGGDQHNRAGQAGQPHWQECADSGGHHWHRGHHEEASHHYHEVGWKSLFSQKYIMFFVDTSPKVWRLHVCSGREPQRVQDMFLIMLVLRFQVSITKS